MTYSSSLRYFPTHRSLKMHSVFFLQGPINVTILLVTIVTEINFIIVVYIIILKNINILYQVFMWKEPDEIDSSSPESSSISIQKTWQNVHCIWFYLWGVYIQIQGRGWPKVILQNRLLVSDLFLKSKTKHDYAVFLVFRYASHK